MNTISWILLALLGFPALYMFFYAVCSKFYKPRKNSTGQRVRSFVVLIPAYKSDSCVLFTAFEAMKQEYPKDKFRVVIISDSMKDITNTLLHETGAEVLVVNFKVSSKAKSLQAAMDYLGENAADCIVILDADNVVMPDFLSSLDDCFEAGAQVVQTHRTAKNADTSVAVLDAAAEEINNSIFRKGHCAVGISSALIGSGMAFQYDWFRQMVGDLNTSGEDKEMEIKLLADGVFVDYAADIPVLDEKTRTTENYARQHRRWIGTQYNMIGDALRKLPTAKFKIGLADKALQWMLPPRMIVVALLPIGAIIASLLDISNANYWWIATAVIFAALFLGMPAKMLDGSLFKALVKAPVLAMTSIINMFRLRGTKHNFIHTDHK